MVFCFCCIRFGLICYAGLDPYGIFSMQSSSNQQCSTFWFSQQFLLNSLRKMCQCFAVASPYKYSFSSSPQPRISSDQQDISASPGLDDTYMSMYIYMYVHIYIYVYMYRGPVSGCFLLGYAFDTLR